MTNGSEQDEARSQSGASFTSNTSSQKKFGLAAAGKPVKQFRLATLVGQSSKPTLTGPSQIKPPTVSAEEAVPPARDMVEPTLPIGMEELRQLVRTESVNVLTQTMTPQVSEHLRKVENHMAESINALATEVQERSRPSVEAYVREKTASAIDVESLLTEAMPQIQQMIANANTENLIRIEQLEAEVRTVRLEVSVLRAQQQLPAKSAENISEVDADIVSPRSKRSSKSSRKKGYKSKSDSSSSSRSSGRSSASDSSSDSDASDKRHKRSLRKTLTELNPANRRFRKVLSYKNYRLYDRSPKEGGKVRRKVSSWIKRMQISVKKFDGTDPISVLSFLAKFKVAADNNGIPEGGARLVLRSFLDGRAANAYDASLYVDAVGSDTVGIRSWPDAVFWLLQTYAKDACIQRAVSEIRGLKQGIQETEYDYGHRVLATFSRIPGVYGQSDQIATFVEGLSEAVSAGVTRDRQLNPSQYSSLHSVMELANSHGIVERVRRNPQRNARLPAKGAFLASPASTGSSSEFTSNTETGTGIAGAFAVEHGNPFSPPTTPTTSTYTQSEFTTGSLDQQAVKPPAEAALPIVTNYNPRLGPDAQPHRPGWVDRGINRPTILRNPNNANANNGTSVKERSCFFCAGTSHYVPDCPFVTEAVRAEARKNIAEASESQKQLLPKWTFALAGIPLPTRDANRDRQRSPIPMRQPQEPGNPALQYGTVNLIQEKD